MEHVFLGRTGLNVSVAGLGCGGHSKLGLRTGGDHQNAVAIVRRALDLGVDIIDTSEVYGTEEAIGEAVEGRRDEVVLATKLVVNTRSGMKNAAEIEDSIDASLKRLRTDRIDIYQAHGIPIDRYEAVVRDVYPVLAAARKKGKIRFIGITEGFSGDTDHKTLREATKSNLWDTIMVGFNILNPCARAQVLPQAIAKNIGVLCMFTVRRGLQSVENLKTFTDKMIADGALDPAAIDRDRPLGFLLDEGIVETLAEAAYRFARYEPGLHCILTGTGSIAHLEENIRSILKDPLPPDALARINGAFGNVDSVSGN